MQPWPRERTIGTFLVAVLALVAWWLGQWPPGAVAFGLGLGLLIGNIRPLSPRLKPGIQWTAKRMLWWAIVLLAAQIPVRTLRDAGAPVLGLAATSILVAIMSALLLGRLLGARSGTALLLGIGTGICGASAIAASRGLAEADDDQVAYAVGAVTVLGTVGLLALPAMQLLAAPFSDAAFGAWAGASLHAVPQAVGAGFAGGGDEGGAMASLVKLTRVALLPVVVLVGSLLWRRNERARVPTEVLGFLAVLLLAQAPWPESVLEATVAVDNVLFLLAFVAIGLQTRLSSLRDGRGLGVAIGTWAAVLTVSFLLVRLWL